MLRRRPRPQRNRLLHRRRALKPPPIPRSSQPQLRKPQPLAPSRPRLTQRLPPIAPKRSPRRLKVVAIIITTITSFTMFITMCTMRRAPRVRQARPELLAPLVRQALPALRVLPPRRSFLARSYQEKGGFKAALFLVSDSRDAPRAVWPLMWLRGATVSRIAIAASAGATIHSANVTITLSDSGFCAVA